MSNETIHPRSFALWFSGELSDRRLSQSDFARRTGLSSALVSNWVNGTRTPSIQSAQAIAEGLGVDIKVVLTKLGLPMVADEDPMRMRLHGMLDALRLTPDRASTLQTLLQMWAEQDRTTAAP